MNLAEEMQNRIAFLENELNKRNQELAENNARFTVLESKIEAVINNEQARQPTITNFNGPKTLVNKPEIFKGDQSLSLDSFIGHTELCIANLSEEMKFKVAVSFLGEHAYNWFMATRQADNIDNWDRLKEMLHARFQPINETKAARDKLAVWKQSKSVAQYNESFLKIIIDIPNISTDEVLDRYMRGL